MSDPWQSYDAKGKHPPPVPEPSAYGALMLLTVISVILLRRFIRRQC